MKKSLHTMLLLQLAPAWVHHDGLIVGINQPAINTFQGCGPGPFLGRRALELNHPMSRNDVAYRIRLMWHSKREQVTPVSELFQTLTGKVLVMSILARPLTLDAKTVLVVGIPVGETGVYRQAGLLPPTGTGPTLLPNGGPEIFLTE